MVMIRCIRARHCLGSVAIVALSTMFGVAAAMRAPDAMAQSTAASAGAGAKEYHTRFRNESGDGIRTVEIDGRIRFSADASRIEWMDDGAYLLVVTNDQGRNVRLRAEPDRNGQPSYRYEIDGRVKRSAADADHWLADTLPIAFRELGHDVEARVQGAYEQGGADEVLRTLAAIRSDYSASQHYVAFFSRKDLSDDDIISALSQLGADIDADEELAKALSGVAALYVERPAIRTSFLACLDQFDSDLVKRRLTHDLFGTETVSGTVPPTMVGSPGNC
jgi:hypothetical protein